MKADVFELFEALQAIQLGRGGTARAKTLSPSERSAIAKKGARARWGRARAVEVEASAPILRLRSSSRREEPPE